jgi:beta-galactosidase/beta-glucuronidase
MLSGIDEVFDERYFRFYRKTFSLEDGFRKERVILNFGAVDSVCRVFLNGQKLCKHIGGYGHFSIDITDYLLEENTLTVCVEDRLSKGILPYGKQSTKRGGMWYTPVSGIWQTVWIESVNQKHIRDLKITTHQNNVDICFGGIENGRILLEGKEYKIENSRAHIEVENPEFWSPENPRLYYFTAQTDSDRIESYFALRDLSIENNRLCLNGKPYFFHGLLDQGYYSDGLFTPANPNGYTDDILRMKELGFNMLRKHIKIEPEFFYYECDRLGMVVFQDFVNNSDYSFLRDTALPTVFSKKKNDKHLHKNPESRRAFEEHMEETVRTLWNHPCICYWTIFNEGWGQFDSQKMYEKLKKLDKTRFIDTASGWFKGAESDVVSEHIYFKPFKYEKTDKPCVLSEFGGYSYKPEGHVFNTKKTYGYKFFESQKEFEDALVALYENEVIPAAKKGLSASVYTQVSDVEDETNGLLSYDRRVCKVNKERMIKIAEELKNI